MVIIVNLSVIIYNKCSIKRKQELVIMKQVDDTINEKIKNDFLVISGMLEEDKSFQDNPDFKNIKTYLKSINLDDLNLLRSYIEGLNSPYIAATSSNPEEYAKANNFLVVLIDCEISDKEKDIKYNEMYNKIISLDLTKVEEYLDTQTITELLVLNYYLTWYKLNHKDTNKVKDELISSLIETNVRVRLGNTFLSAD